MFKRLIGNKPHDSFLLPKGILIQGDIESVIPGRIDGNVLGNINVDAKLVIGEEAIITGDISAVHLIVYGKVEGNIECKTKAVICNNAIIKGGIIASTLEIEEGAVIEGSMTKNRFKSLDVHPKNLGEEKTPQPKKIISSNNSIPSIEVRKSISSEPPSTDGWF